MKGYIDLIALPLAKKNLRAYRRMSGEMGKIMKDLGALEYREFMGDDLNVKGTAGFPSKVRLSAARSCLRRSSAFGRGRTVTLSTRR